MKKIIYILHEDDLYGAPKSLIDLLLDMTNSGIHPIILTHGIDDNYKFCKNHGLEVYALGHINYVCGKKKNVLSYFKLMPKRIIEQINNVYAYWTLKKYINSDDIALIHSNVSILSFGGYLSKKMHVPHVIHVREPAAVVDDYLFTVGNIVDFLNRTADKFICISNHSAQQWREKGLNCNKICVVYDGVKIATKDKLKEASNIIKIVAVGTLCERKNQKLIVDAIKGLNETYRNRVEVTFVGGGDDRYISEMKEVIDDNKMNEIFKFSGYKENVSELYKNYDVGIIASIGEPFGRVTVEYLANGLLTMVSNSGANTEIVEDMVSGIVFDSNNSEDLSCKICKIIDDINKYDFIRINGIERAKKFNTSESVRSLAKIYNEILNEETYYR